MTVTMKRTEPSALTWEGLQARLMEGWGETLLGVVDAYGDVGLACYDGVFYPDLGMWLGEIAANQHEPFRIVNISIEVSE